MFTSSTGVQSDGLRLCTASAPTASCMVTGLLCQSANHRRLCDDAHLQDVDLRPDKGARQLPASREETFQASFDVGMRTLGPVRGSTRRGRREHQRLFQVVVVGEVNSLSDAWRRRPGGRGRPVPAQGVLLLGALLPRRRPDDEDRGQLLFVDGATRLTRPNPASHPPREPPFDLQQKGSGGGGRTRGTRRARPRRAVRGRRRWYREPRGTSPTLLAQEPRDGRCPETLQNRGTKMASS